MPEQSTPRISTTSAGALLLAILLAGYVGSFVYFSRTGMQRAEELGYENGYDLLADNRSFETIFGKESLKKFYYPLIEVDARMISGQRPRILPPVSYFMSEDHVQFYPNAP